MSKYLVVIFLLLSSSVAHAFDYQVLGVGNAPCSNVIEDYQKVPKQAHQIYYSWFAGFATGANAMVDNKRNIHFDVDGQWKVLISYCKEFPKHKFENAAIQTLLQMPKN